MKKVNIVEWIHGVQSENFDPQTIEDCKNAVDALLPKGQFIHHIYNWDKIVTPRELQTYDIVKRRGNWLTNKVRKAICLTGMDMWWNLQTLRDNKSSYIFYEIQKELGDNIRILSDTYQKQGYDVNIHFVAHSWGTWVGLQYIINNPNQRVNFVTMGCPLLYGSGIYEDWGDPEKLKNIVAWTNLGIANDPISTLMGDSPNPKWKNFVKDVDINYFVFPRLPFPLQTPFPLDSHTAYWKLPEARKEIAKALVLNS